MPRIQANGLGSRVLRDTKEAIMSMPRDIMEDKLLLVRVCRCGHSETMHRHHHAPHACLAPRCDCRDYKPMDWITDFCEVPDVISR